MTQKQNTDPRSLPWLSLSTMYYLIVGLIWVAAFVPDARLWGINWYRYFGWPGQALLLGGGLVAPWLIERWLSREERKPARRCWLTGTAVTVGFLVCFLLGVGRTHFLGDGYQVLGKLLAEMEVIKPWDSAVWTIQKTIFRLAGGVDEADARLVLRSISIGSGVIVLLMLIGAARALAESTRARVFFVMASATAGYMLLFFGYIENYPLLVTGFMALGLTGLMILRARWPRWTILVPTVWVLVLHPFGVAAIPAVTYVLLRDSTPGRRVGAWSVTVRAALVLLLAAIAGVGIAYGWQSSLFFRFSLVPPVADQFTVEGYTLFSSSHLLDFVNLIVMLCPGLPVAILLAVRQPASTDSNRTAYWFLGLLALAALAIVFIFNPRLGMPRDWDLFAFASVPLMLLASVLVLDRWDNSRARVGGWLMVFLGLLLLTPRVVSQAIPETSIAVFDHFADLDVVKSRNGRFLLQQYLERAGRLEEHTRRARTNAIVLPHEGAAEAGRRLSEQGRLAEAVPKFRQALRLDPSYHYAWSHLGVTYNWMGKYDSALICLHIADGLNPYSFTTYMQLAGTCSAAGDDARAEAYWLKAARLEPDDLECRYYLLRLYRQQSRWPELDELMDDLASRDSLSLEILEPIARRQLERDDTAGAALSCRKALSLGLDTAAVLMLQEEFPQLKVIAPD